MDIDLEQLGNCLGKFLCVRVRIDLNTPLLTALQLPKIRCDEPVMVFLIYERCLIFVITVD